MKTATQLTFATLLLLFAIQSARLHAAPNVPDPRMSFFVTSGPGR